MVLKPGRVLKLRVWGGGERKSFWSNNTSEVLCTVAKVGRGVKFEYFTVLSFLSYHAKPFPIKVRPPAEALGVSR